MRVISLVVAWLLLSGHGVLAQEPELTPGQPETPGAESEVEVPGLDTDEGQRVEELRAELRALLEQSREGAENVVREFQATTGLTDSQVYGIAAGIVAGALIADLMGGGGLATIALAAAGGALGNWIMSEG